MSSACNGSFVVRGGGLQGPAGPVGPAGPAGMGAIIAYAAGDPITLTAVLPPTLSTGEAVGFGEAGALALDNPIDLESGTVANLAFSMPRDGALTGLSAYFSVTGDVVVGDSVDIHAQLYQSTGPDNSFVPIAGTDILLGTIASPIATGTIVQSTITLADIAVAAGTRLLLVFSAVSTGGATAFEIVGHASGGLAIA